MSMRMSRAHPRGSRPVGMPHASMASICFSEGWLNWWYPWSMMMSALLNRSKSPSPVFGKHPEANPTTASTSSWNDRSNSAMRPTALPPSMRLRSVQSRKSPSFLTMVSASMSQNLSRETLPSEAMPLRTSSLQSTKWRAMRSSMTSPGVL